MTFNAGFFAIWQKMNTAKMNGKKPNKQEQAWIDAIVEYGCLVCRNELGLFSPPSVHHINGSKKEGCHLETLPLCFNHHQSGINNENFVSLHPWRAEFKKRYGSEQELLKQLQDEINGEQHNGFNKWRGFIASILIYLLYFIGD